jgi:hypothetical protein
VRGSIRSRRLSAVVTVIQRFGRVDLGSTKSNRWTEMMFELVAKSNTVAIDGASGVSGSLKELSERKTDPECASGLPHRRYPASQSEG